MNTRAASILIAGGGLIFLCGTLAMKAQHTGACLQARIYAWECRQMTPQQRELFIKARYCLESGRYESAAVCLKMLRETETESLSMEGARVP